MSDTSREFLQRFAISGLSKERKDEAINEEILLGKYTGEFFIKSKDGVIISTDILNRLKSSTENAIRYAESAGMVGDIYKIDFENIIMPCHIDYDINILGNEPIDLGHCNEFLLNFDYDEFDIVGDEVRPVNGENIVQLTIEVVKINGFVEEVVNTNQLIINSLFGNMLPDPYDENKVYNKGDVIVRLKDDGNYELLVCDKNNVTGPFNEDNWSPISFTDLFKDSSVILQNNTSIKNIQEGMADDLATLVYNLAGILDNKMEFNQIYRENFRNLDNINLINGNFEMGFVESNNILEFQMNEPKEIQFKPIKVKLKHFIEIIGTVGIECDITFNALDNDPFWFNINDAIMDGSFFDIPEFEKEDNIQYAMNIRIKCNCEENSSIKISDLMVVFI